MWDKSIEAFQQGAFATAARSGNEHEFACWQGKGYIFDDLWWFSWSCYWCA
jgi:hypothetical protein